MTAADSVKLGNIEDSELQIEQSGVAETREVTAGDVQGTKLSVQQHAENTPPPTTKNLWSLLRDNLLALIVTVVGGVLVVVITLRWFKRNEDQA